MNGDKLKREISGILLGIIAVFYVGSLLFYHHADTEALVGLQWYEFFGRKAMEAVEKLHNPFGIAGARLAELFIRSFLGYVSIIPGFAVFYWGWSLMRDRSLKAPLLFTLYSVIIALDIAALFGLTSMPFGDAMSGAVGRMLASFFSTFIGYTGAWILLVFLGIAASLFALRILVSDPVERLRSALAGLTSFLARALSFFGKLKKQRSAGIQEDEEQPGLPFPDEVPSSGTSDKSGDGYETDAEYSGLPDEEPEITIREGVHEKEADLDKRKLKVKTKDRVAYRFPSIDLLRRKREDDDYIDEKLLEDSKSRLLDKLRIYNIDVVRVSATVGPRVTLFELELAPHVKVSRVTSLENDLAMAMAARGIRIIAPIPGKNAVGVEIPHGKPRTVWMRSVLQVEKFKNNRMTLPVVLGKTIANEVYLDDLSTMPHLLIAGATGSGKSVGINVMLTSLLYTCSPDKVKFVLIDPKRVELLHYQNLKNHFLVKFDGLDEQIITDPDKAVYALKSVEKEMEERYEHLKQAGVRNIQDFNRRRPEETLPYLVVVVDELADLMITAGRDVEEPITRLAQLARAVGIHLIVATQRPSVDVITGIIKANFPARIAFQVASKVDSRTILDGSGAEQLLGNGDMLYQPASQPKPERIQCPYVSSTEVESITSFIGRQDGLKNFYLLPKPEIREKGGSAQNGGFQDKEGRDPMFADAAHLVVMHQQGSVSLLQRRLKLGFSRAARIMDQLEAAGIVGPADGSKARSVLIDNHDSLDLLLRNLD